MDLSYKYEIHPLHPLQNNLGKNRSGVASVRRLRVSFVRVQSNEKPPRSCKKRRKKEKSKRKELAAKGHTAPQ
jgi:hypothetical protein